MVQGCSGNRNRSIAARVLVRQSGAIERRNGQTRGRPATLQTDTTPGFIGRIPVRNIWLLLLYASQLYKELPESRRVDMENAPEDIPELVSEILANAVDRRLRRNLSHGYQRRETDLNRVRGRINLLRTERRQLLQRARVACIFDELTVDTPRNRYLKAALDRLGRFIEHGNLPSRCLNLAARLEGLVSRPNRVRGGCAVTCPLNSGFGCPAKNGRCLPLPGSPWTFQFPRRNRDQPCCPAQTDAKAGDGSCEKTVAGFYDAVLDPRDWRVRPQSPIAWPIENPTHRMDDLVPGMIRDIVLESRNTVDPSIINDTKFTSIVDLGHYGQQRFSSGNIYQIYAYLRSQEHDGDPLSHHSTGVLLYSSWGSTTTNQRPSRPIRSVSPPWTWRMTPGPSANNCCE